MRPHPEKHGGNSHPSLERDLDPPLVGDESQRSGDRILITIVRGICLYPQGLPGELLECQNLPGGEKQENAEIFTTSRIKKKTPKHSEDMK